MKISYLPEVISPTETTIVPIVNTSGVSKKVKLKTLENFSGEGLIANVFPGNNISLNPSPATTTSTISFSFPGSIYPFPGETSNIPLGWLLCNGQAVSRAVYKDLFDIVGITYGAGDNRTTFTLPDLRGRTVFGKETMGGISGSGRLTNTLFGNIDGTTLGAEGGEQSHTLTPSEASLRSHTHSFSASTTIYSGPQSVDDRSSGCDTPGVAGANCNQVAHVMPYQFTTLATADSTATPHNNLPPLVFLNWVIKY
jgi:microcystin-dependent protein